MQSSAGVIHVSLQVIYDFRNSGCSFFNCIGNKIAENAVPFLFPAHSGIVSRALCFGRAYNYGAIRLILEYLICQRFD